MIRITVIDCLISENCEYYGLNCELCLRNRAIVKQKDHFKANKNIKEKIRGVVNVSK